MVERIYTWDCSICGKVFHGTNSDRLDHIEECREIKLAYRPIPPVDDLTQALRRIDELQKKVDIYESARRHAWGKRARAAAIAYAFCFILYGPLIALAKYCDASTAMSVSPFAHPLIFHGLLGASVLIYLTVRSTEHRCRR